MKLQKDLCGVSDRLFLIVSLLALLTVAESLDAAEDLITMDNGCVCCSVRIKQSFDE